MPRGMLVREAAWGGVEDGDNAAGGVDGADQFAGLNSMADWAAKRR